MKVNIVMGSNSDWPTMENASNMLKSLGIAHDSLIVSAHRTPDRLYEFAKSAEEKGIQVIIAGAGGAAHLPGMIASLTKIPVLGVPIQSKTLNGIDSLLSIVQMPAGVPVATFAIGVAGATNAAIFAASILSLSDSTIREKLANYHKEKTLSVALHPQ